MALDSRQLKYTTENVPFLSRGARAKVLPSGGYFVPEMTVTTAEDGTPEIIPDSSAILRRIDTLAAGHEGLFKTEDIGEAEKHICGKINALVLYFNHVSDEGWSRSIREKMRQSVPALLRPVIPYAILMRSVRSSMRERVADELAVSEKDMNDVTMRKRLEYELMRYEEMLVQQPRFLYNTDLPSAADCSLYAMLCRFVGTMGDAQLPPCLPDLWEKADGLANLKVWYQRIEKDYPFVWTRNDIQ